MIRELNFLIRELECFVKLRGECKYLGETFQTHYAVTDCNTLMAWLVTVESRLLGPPPAHGLSFRDHKELKMAAAKVRITKRMDVALKFIHVFRAYNASYGKAPCREDELQDLIVRSISWPAYIDMIRNIERLPMSSALKLFNSLRNRDPVIHQK